MESRQDWNQLQQCFFLSESGWYAFILTACPIFSRNSLGTDPLIIATESIQVSQENHKTTCFVCHKMILGDPSKQHLHIGKHILKALGNVSDTPAPVNVIGGSSFSSFFIQMSVTGR